MAYSRYPIYDGVGLVRALVDDSGAMTDNNVLDTFGRQIAASGTTPNLARSRPPVGGRDRHGGAARPHLATYRFGAAWGYITDTPGSGLLQLGARYYWPELGRFIQQDPTGDGANWYAYADNDPVWGVDPDGLLTIPGIGGNPWLVFDDSVFLQWYKSAGATATGLVNGASLGLVPLAKHFGLLSPCFADWTDPCDKYAAWSKGWGTVSGASLTAAASLGVARAAGVEVNVSSRGNIFKIISKGLRRGFRIDPAHHGKPWGHPHYWKW